MRSYVEFRAAPAHDGRAFECFAHNPTFGHPRNLSARITLVVLCELNGEGTEDVSVKARCHIKSMR